MTLSRELEFGGEEILAAHDYAEMGNTAAADEVCHSADEWHAMFNANINATAPHLIRGFTFHTGLEGGGDITISGADITIADGDHGLETGDFVTVQSANHAGIGTVTKTDDHNFIVDIAWAADQVCTWQMGSYLKCTKADLYRGVWTASVSQSLNAKHISQVTPVLDATANPKAASPVRIDNNTDVDGMHGNGLMSFSVNERIWFAVQSDAAQTITFETRNVSIH